MDCPNCGAYTQGAFCPQCGMPVQQHASAPQQYASAPQQYASATQAASQPTGNKTQPWIYAAVIAALLALGAGSFFLISELSGDKKDSSLPPTVNTSSSASASQSAPASPTQTSTPTQTAPVSTPTATSTPTTSSVEEINAAVTKEFDDRADRDINTVTVGDGSWAARVSTKWIGITDDQHHPAPYTATEIKQEFDDLSAQYGDKLRILRVGAVGKQTSGIAGKHGWIAVVVDPSINSRQSALDWCAANYNSDIWKCGEQQLNAPHPG